MAHSWINLPRSEGTASRQAHADLPAGTYEREIGREGFFGPVTQMHHTHPPTGWAAFEGPLRPRAFDGTRIEPTGNGPWGAAPLLSNAAVKMRLWRGHGAMDHLARNADGDELLFFHEGAGALFCDYGHLAVREGDYVLLPRGTMWRLDTSEPFAVLMIEASGGSYQLPERGLVGYNAVFDPAVLDTPAIDEAFRAQQAEEAWVVLVKRDGALSRITYPFNPLDAVGWHGTLAPVRLNWRDIRPLMSHRYHLPPSAHTTFVGPRFVVCTFVPRPLESDPGALKVPFFHSNDDFDEVIFYHRGTFFSRDNIHPGMMTYHPGGFTHGPHPKALKAGLAGAKKDTDEVAVMLDARDPLSVDAAAAAVEWTGYVDSWREAAK
ncbi:MAG TPA: homogentisate 1,2-dioxygenase [Methylomirabilota bacterium]|jgi:homogentisate 1,2-dioxygenase|nr:homogentisate 1,2-dioxygenase [Methylomirabilota bacterium]